MQKGIKQKCSNCGKINYYFKKEYKGREFTLCKYCGHTLTVTDGFIKSLMSEKEYEEFQKICNET